MIYLFPPPAGQLHAKAYISFRHQLLSLSTTVYPEQLLHGLLGAIIPQAEWLQVPGVDLGDPLVDYSFVPPRRPVGAFPNTAVAQAAWKREEAIFTSFTTSMQTIKAFILASVDPMFLRTIDPRHTAYLMTPSDLLALLDARYLVMNPSDIAQARATLSMVFTPPQLIRVFIADHIETHELLASNQAVVNGVDQFQALLQAVTKCGLFRDAISHYMNAHPTTTLQTFTSLAEALIAASDNLINDGQPMHTMALAATHGEPQIVQVSSTRDNTFKLVGHQPSSSKQRIGTFGVVTQYFCAKHGWCMKQHDNCDSKKS